MRVSFSKSPAPEIPQAELIEVYRKALQSGVPLETVEQKIDTLIVRTQVTQKVESQRTHEKKQELQRKVPMPVRVGAWAVPSALIVGGLVLISSAILPILNFYLTTLPNFQASALMAPVPNEHVLDVNPVVIAQAQAAEDTETSNPSQPVIIDQELDFTNLSNWFDAGDQANMLNAGSSNAQTYTLNIPKLNINNAVVTIGGTDLSHSLIQFPGTALPGENGAPVIFGHSVLRQFYNPSEKNPRRYTSIFSTIMTLQKGDEIFVTHQGIEYKYRVQEKIQVKPTDTFILTQKFDAKTLKLVTCTPEGTYLFRGVVVAQLVN